MNAPAVSDETLAAFVDDELAPVEAARVADAVAADPALAQRLAAQRTAREAARAAFRDVVHEPVPAALIAAVLAADAKVTSPPARPANAAPVWRVAAMAAAVALIVGGIGGASLFPARDRVAGVLNPLAQPGPALARALEGTASGDQVSFDGGSVHLLASYPTDVGFCRAFMIDGDAAASGLACREDGAWRMRMAVARQPSREGFVPASGEDPLLRDLLDRMGATAPLDAATERDAIGRAWR